MFEREKLSGNNFNDWFRQLKLVLRVEKKIFVIEHPLPAAHAANSEAQVLLEWNAVYDAYNEVAYLILGSMTAELHRQFENSSPYDMIKELKAMFEKQAGVERFDLIQTFHACKQEEGKPVAAYVIQMKGYVDQLECLGYVLPHDLIVGLILNGLTKDFFGFVRNYNMHNMGKTVGELHVMLIEYEKGLPKKAKTPQVMMIKSGKIQKVNKKSLKVKGKGKANGKGKDKQVYIPKPKNPKPSAKENPTKDDVCHHCKEVGHWKRIYHVYLVELLKKKKQVGSASSSGNGVRTQVEAIGSFDLVLPNGLVICLDNCHYAPSITRGVVLVHRLVENGFEGLLKSTDDESLINAYLVYQDYALESATRILNIVPTKKVDKTPYELWYGKVPNLSYLKVWGCEALVKQDTPDKPQQRSFKYEDTSPSEITSEIPMKVEGFEPPQEEKIPIRRSERTRRAPNRLCLNLESEEHILVDLPPGCKTVGSKWIFKKKTNMDGIIHTYKARLVAKAAYYDYEIWQMDIKTAFFYGYLDEDIHMVQPEGFVDPNHPRKVCKLQRSIYGLKQASRIWNKRFDKEIKRFGFAQNLDEPCVYQKASGSNVTFLILYVDDIIIMGNHIPSLQSVKDYLGKCFAMKDLGEATFILGIKIYRDRSKRLIRLGQNAYINKILKRYRMDNSKRGHIPIQERLNLNKTQGASTPEEVKRMQNVPYASAVGSIMYAVRCTRPDVAFAQNITSHFQQNPGECH
ncbi:retrotransposon protein, putative, ty1-copia subclass [Tanacetum coccineum]